jgi:hypothetical protein
MKLETGSLDKFAVQQERFDCLCQQPFNDQVPLQNNLGHIIHFAKLVRDRF